MELEEKLKEIAKKAKNKEDKDNLINRVKNLEKIAVEMYNRLKSEKSQSNEKKPEQQPEYQNNVDINQCSDEIKEINNKLDKILDTINNNNYEKIENMLKEILDKLESMKYVNLSEDAINQISDKIKQIYDSSKMEFIEKLDIIIENTNNYSSKLDKLSNEIDNITEKIDKMSEKITDLLDSGGVKVVDIIKLIKEIYKGINEIKEILNNLEEESINKAIKIADDLNTKIDSYLVEIEEGINA
ncbi:hypothetical protein JH146_0935 [Methanocaldococcus bathoardescens]|uniref:Uncharacterized protein n=1 Tax=Methanocaldococcus bathoardescens TaxID=1301915 RepID=A0A076LBK7_9EURY|nr:hypothetical protein [Methanocaldococcus bathoardescens]AIJ05780.1 hypothetical protein JH146_0935 [Methanocaldococcus bathoardescens]